MKLSKSILDPIRATRDFSFLSCRLRSNGSRKGGGLASPFGKKRGGALETHEPSSPKVTCIGQVRVKSKRKAKAKANAKQFRSLSRRGDLGEASFRKADHSRRHDRNQRWVHLPISICEALRGFGAEFCCLFHCRCRCRWCCFSMPAEKRGGCCGNNGRGCGAVFCRWLLCVSEEGGGGGKREIEVVVGGAAATAEERISRRHVFEDIEVRDGRIEVKGEEELARVSICIPPKNALLLMRCRSDPMKMAALANRISWAASKCENGTEGIEEEECFGEEIEQICEEDKCEILRDALDPVFEEIVTVSVDQGQGIQNEANLEMEDRDHDQEELELVTVEATEQETAEVQLQEEEEEEVESNMSSFEALLDQENTEHYEDSSIQVNQEFQDSPNCHSNEEATECVQQLPPLPCRQETEEGLITTESDEGAILATNQAIAQPQTHQDEEQNIQKESIQESQAVKNQETKKENEAPVLPDCLLLMMCEPKLSMEVSKETWVRGTDFIRWLPARKPAKAAKTGCCHQEPAPVKRRPNNEYSSKPTKPSLPVPPPPSKKNDHQQPRSSCSLPAAASSMANMLEQKLVGGTYEPFVLTRCKSEPMRAAAAKLAPESIFWKNSSLKMEPHRVGVGAAGIS